MRHILLLLAVLSLSACGFEQVDTGYRGVKTTFGEVDLKEGSMKEGLYFYNPFTSNIIEMDTRIQSFKGETNTYTRDVQQANITYVVNLRLSQDSAHLVYANVGVGWVSVLVPQAVEGVLKQVVGTYDAVDLVSQRSKATTQIQQAIADGLKSKNVIVDRVELVNIAYLKEFEKSVEDKVVAIQKAIEEKNRTQQIEEQAKQRIINAKAEAESMRIRANALQQNAKLVEYEAVQKWDGHMPQIVTGSGSIPFINIPSK